MIQSSKMKHVNLPIPTSWKLFLHQLYLKLHGQLTSPWTKLCVLVLLMMAFTRKELSLRISVNGADWFSIHESSVFTDSGSELVVHSSGHEVSDDDSETKRQWTAKQLRQLKYVSEYKHIALQEMVAHGIPASITLAQGLLESGTGQSTLARKNHNHFGIKCFSKKCAKGHCSNHSDDHHKDFFRNFTTPEESYRAHSAILGKKRYRKLFALAKTDYKGWAHGLRKAGYATDPKYGDKLIKLIEELELHRYDR